MKQMLNLYRIGEAMDIDSESDYEFEEPAVVGGFYSKDFILPGQAIQK